MSVDRSPSRLLERVIWFALGLTVLVIAGTYIWKLRQNSSPPLPVLGHAPAFTLTNQFGARVSEKALEGSIWVSDVFFTRCPIICEQMTRRLKGFQDALNASDAVKLVSITSDPEFDTPEVLLRYSTRHGAESNRWQFLTGDKPAVHRLTVDGLKFVAVEKTPEEQENPNDLFIHSTRLAVVDRRGQIRAYVDTEDKGAATNLLRVVRQLQKERP